MSHLQLLVILYFTGLFAYNYDLPNWFINLPKPALEIIIFCQVGLLNQHELNIIDLPLSVYRNSDGIPRFGQVALRHG